MFRQPLVVHLLLLLLMMIWGATFAAIKVLLREVDPLQATALRFAVASIALLGLLPLLPKPQLLRGDRLRLALVGLLTVAVYHLSLNSGVKDIPAGVASLVIATNPTFVAALAALLLREPLSVKKIAGIVLAFIGLAIVALLGSSSGVDGRSISLRGLGITMLAPVAWAFATIISKPLLARVNPMTMTTYATLVGSLFLSPLAPSLAGSLPRLSAWGWLAALYLGLFGTVTGYIIWYNGLRVLSTVSTTIYVNLIPFFGLLAGWLLLDERVTLFLVIGGLLIVAGVLLTNLGDEWARRRAQSREVRKGSEALSQ